VISGENTIVSKQKQVIKGKFELYT